ncbi:MAG: outer membrane beta-barrel protein [Candidatus Dadabacteria bacterium]|nr:outer membrane beta-barrel protein [Candidatus Dadabacteria bacterium]
MRYVAGDLCFWLAAVLLIFGSSSASAEDRFYIGLEAGFSASGDLDVSQSFFNHPTRCHSVLYQGSGLNPPTDGECAAAKRSSFGNIFNPGIGFAGGATLGYALGNGLRFEAEYLNRRQGSARDLVSLGSDSDDVLDQKGNEWSEEDPPWARVRDLNTHHFFVNAYYDLRNESPFTPYIGGGIGVGSMRIGYSSAWLRKSDLGMETWQDAAENTTSSIDTKLEKTRFGFQMIGGVDYALGDDLSVGAKVRWTRFSGFDRDDVRWTQTFSREPARADGVTPFTTDFKVGDTDSWIFTVGLKYYL